MERNKKSTSPVRRTKGGKKKGAGHDPDAAMMEAWQKSMTPGAGHRRLEPLVGTFETTSKIWMQPGAPPSEGSGVSKHKWVLGGRYIEQSYRGKTMGMPFQGVGYTGYDNVQKKYVGSWMDSMGTGIMTSVGTGKPSAKKMEFESTVADPVTGKNTKFRTIVRVKDNDRHSFEMWGKGPGGKEFRTMLIDYKRK